MPPKTPQSAKKSAKKKKKAAKNAKNQQTADSEGHLANTLESLEISDTPSNVVQQGGARMVRQDECEEEKSEIEAPLVSVLGDLVAGGSPPPAAAAAAPPPPAAAAAPAPTVGTDCLQDCGINELDDPEKTLDWILNAGAIDSKSLTKHMPHTAEDLLDGKISPQDFVDRFSRWGETRIKQKLWNVGVKLLTENLVQASWFRTETQESWWRTQGFDLFYSELRRQCPRQWFMKDPGEPNSMMQTAVQATCAKFADVMDGAIFPGRRSGAFLFLCPLYGLSINDFSHRLNNLLATSSDYRDVYPSQLGK